jgi:hypothetical protein
LAHHAAVKPCLLLHHHVAPVKGLIVPIIPLEAAVEPCLLLLASKAALLLLLLHGCVKVIVQLVKGPILLTSSPAAACGWRTHDTQSENTRYATRDDVNACRCIRAEGQTKAGCAAHVLTRTASESRQSD